MAKQIFQFGQPAINVVTDYLSLNNVNFKLPASQLTFGSPVVVADPLVGVDVSVTNLNVLNFAGSVNVTYNRVDFADYFVGVSPTLDASKGTDDVSLLIALADRYQLLLGTDGSTPAALQNQVSLVVTSDGDATMLTVTAGDDNLVWKGSQTFLLTNVVQVSA